MNLQLPEKVPTGITVTAWTWIVIGLLMTLSGMGAGVAYSTFGGTVVSPPTADTPVVFAVLITMFRYLAVLTVLQLLVAVLAIWSGIALLRLKAWARRTVEALSWLALVYCVGFGLFSFYLMISISRLDSPGAGAHAGTDVSLTTSAVVDAVITAIFAVPFGIMIRYLRRPEARAATASTRPTGA